ncbi:hypothetical protein ACFOD3_26290 [Falsiroseomonas tokyonensis]|uniref:Uncharacterized protein n=1 Tax=Falsiroseomonas tokyonensis TaxID=430521 RepID=A0ABV7C0M3_9PROT|nr:hypothetical protein [Falsiroseomonas tokyonensis]
MSVKSTIPWGPLQVDGVKTFRVPRKFADKDTAIGQELRFLDGIALLSQLDLLILHQSRELRSEQWRQTAGRYMGYGIYDRAVKYKFTPFNEQLHDIHRLGCDITEQFSTKQKHQEWLKHISDEPFKTLVAQLGSHHTLDAWHVHSAQVHGIEYFLTTDFKIINALRNKNRTLQRVLKVRALRPSELAAEIGLLPVDLDKVLIQSGDVPISLDLKAQHGGRRVRRG